MSDTPEFHVNNVVRIGAVLVALGLFSSKSEAQLVNGVWQGSAQTGGSVAIARDPQPQVIIVQPSSTVFSRSVFPRQPIAFTMIPAFVLSDGTVVANFGFGFEPVFRSCSGAVVVGEPRVIAGNGVVLSSGTPTTYTQPVPNQLTPSQQMLSSTQSTNAASVSLAARSACFGRDAAGRIVVFR